MSKIPPYLQPGSTIGITAPAGFMALEKMSACIDTLQEWGYTVRLGDTTHSNSATYFSGTDDERAQDLQRLLDDPTVDAILFARGGYGLSRIVDRLHFKAFKKHPKWLIGFSDVTVLHSHIWEEYGIASLHAPMAAAFNEEGPGSHFVNTLRDALAGTPADYRAEPHVLNRPGQAEGPLVGGNLSLLVHSLGTPSELRTKKSILFLEDIGEYLYSVDRMMLQLKRSGKLERLAGLVVGGFTDIKDTERPFGKNVYELIADHVSGYEYPVCFGFPVSHGKENVALKHGVEHKLHVDRGEVRLTEDE
ncbi:LD-carboxypeptidase [Flaviaesturariibacter amylovorans]|uniref:LD-carboxypeptidase n=1 Tax=Flaviaesturariibacter amylovorans TaxID=1084520 RepID=A0ABP8HCW1_9BACT